MDYKGRQRRLLQEMENARLDALLVTHLPNIRYLCGFTGSNGALVMSRKPVFLTDGRYTEQAREEVREARTVISKGQLLAAVAGVIEKSQIGRLGIEADHMTVASRGVLAKVVAKTLKLVETSGIVSRLRIVKDGAELESIRAAVSLASRLFKPVLRSMRAGVSEQAVAARLEYLARRAGAEAMSFETIVASGVRSALPHGKASAEPLPKRGFVVMDYGVILNGYCSDMTRTVHVGKAGEKERSLYRAVLEAQLSAITAVSPGATVGEVDDAARSVLKKAKLDKYFTHSTGHGVGLEIHEPPRVAARQDQVLQPGMVITIEPGVYIAGKCGIRIEDMVLVTERGFEVLTPATKELIEI